MVCVQKRHACMLFCQIAFSSSLFFLLWILSVHVEAIPFTSDSVELEQSSALDADSMSDSARSLSQDSILGSNPEALQAECTSDASEGHWNKDTITKRARDANSCSVVPKLGTAPDMFTPWVKKLLETVETIPRRRQSSSMDSECGGHEGRLTYVTCAGPEVDANFEFIPLVLDCVLGKISKVYAYPFPGLNPSRREDVEYN